MRTRLGGSLGVELGLRVSRYLGRSMGTAQTNNLDGIELSVNLSFDSDSVGSHAGDVQKPEVMGKEIIGEAFELRALAIREGLEGKHVEGSK